MLVPTTCDVCKVDDSEPVAVASDFEYQTSEDEYLAVRCRRCGLVYLNPRPDEPSLGTTYPDRYHAFNFGARRFGAVFRARRRVDARRLLGWCRGLPEDARILDLGCGDGFHVDLLRRRGQPGWRVEGVDADPRAQEGARERGVEILCGDVRSLPLPERSYDLVLMMMSIEHLSAPSETLARVQALLKPGGRLVVTTNHTDAADFSVFSARYWGGYDFPRHLNIFNRRNLTAVGQRAGLEPVKFRTAWSPVNWAFSIHHWLQDWRGPRWVVERFSLYSPIVLALLTLVDLPMAWMGHGAILQAIFRKPDELL